MGCDESGMEKRWARCQQETEQDQRVKKGAGVSMSEKKTKKLDPRIERLLEWMLEARRVRKQLFSAQTG